MKRKTSKRTLEKPGKESKNRIKGVRPLRLFLGKVDWDFREFCLYCFCTNFNVNLDRKVEQNVKTR